MGAADRFEVLPWLRASGLTVTLDAGQLLVRPAKCLTDDARSMIRAHRSNIIALLEAEREELTCLVRQCGEVYGFSEQEHVEALARAVADPEHALLCFRAIASESSNG